MANNVLSGVMRCINANCGLFDHEFNIPYDVFVKSEWRVKALLADCKKLEEEYEKVRGTISLNKFIGTAR
jgi:hypothetical protein